MKEYNRAILDVLEVIDHEIKTGKRYLDNRGFFSKLIVSNEIPELVMSYVEELKLKIGRLRRD